MNSFFEIDYEIEAVFDEYGDFPLECAILLFDLLSINGNIVIKNRYSIKEEKTEVIKKYTENIENCFYECPKDPEANYCVWIKQNFSTNQQLINILKLQGIYLSYIVPNDSFNWESFLRNWNEDEKSLLLSNQASFVCNVIDMDRTLNVSFNTAVFSMVRITSIITEWERLIMNFAGSAKVKKTVGQMRSKYGNKHVVRLCFS